MFELMMPELLSAISDARLKQYVKIETIKLVSAKSQDVEKMRAVGRIWIKNPIVERIQEYVELYKQKDENLENLKQLKQTTLHLCDEMVGVFNDIMVKRRDFLDSVEENLGDNQDNIAGLRLEYDSLIAILKNITQLDEKEVFIQ
jgi:hypothetical protein